MRRAALLGITALLASLALTASAGADIPRVHGGSVLGKDLPLKVYASISPAVHTFGSPLTARVAVLADSKWVAPANVRTIVHFAPYEPAGPPTVVRTSNGRLLQMTWTWKLRCLSVKCLPVMKKSDLAHIFRFSPAHVEYLSPEGQVRYAIDARFQRIAVLSELSPSEIALLNAHSLAWYDQLTPLPAAQYRVSPDLAFWLSVAMAAVLGAAEFDRAFAGIRFAEVEGPLLYVFARDEAAAATIEDDFSPLIADIAGRILKHEIEVVLVLPKVLQ